MKYTAKCIFTTAEDDFDGGEDPSTERSWTEDIEPSATLEELLGNVPYARCDAYGENHRFENDPCEEGEFGRFDCDFLVKADASGDICRPSDGDLASWRNGSLKLLNLHVSVYVEKTCPLALDDVAGLRQANASARPV